MVKNYGFSKFIKAYLLNGFVNSFNAGTNDVWLPYTNYSVGEVVVHTYTSNFESITNRYICVSGYKSGNNPPIHSQQGEIVSDGGIRWLYIDSLSNIDTGMDNLYVTFGRSDEWDNGDYPPDAEINSKNTPQSISDIIYARKINKNYISLVVNRNTWESGVVYDEYSSDKNEYDKLHYITNNQGMIYYCLYNNNGSESEIEPMGESSEPINTMDGYTWLYLGKVSIDANKFLSDEYIPINKDVVFNPHLETHKGGIASIDMSMVQVSSFDEDDDVVVELQNYGSGSGATFNVIKNVAGIIETVEIVTAGSDYAPSTRAIIKNNLFDGFGATATASINLDGSLDNITVTNSGEDYSQAVVIIDGDGVGAEAEVVISSIGAISDVIITNSGSGYTYANVYIIEGNSAKLCDVKMLPYNTNKIDILSSFNNASVMFLSEINPTDDYFPYDTYYRECMLTVNLYEKDGYTIANKNEYIGSGHNEWANDDSTLRKLDDTNGFILYRQVTNKLMHVDSQSEMIKFIISLG